MGAPKAPEKPIEVLEALNGNVKLKIKVPSDDGGSPITGYTIEKFEDGKWVRAAFVPGNKVGNKDAFEVNIPNLENGKPYKFRVKAENDEGESDYTLTDVRLLLLRKLTSGKYLNLFLGRSNSNRYSYRSG